MLVFHDVSDKRDLMRQLFHQAQHDALTGLPNRLLFNDRAHQAIVQTHHHQEQVAVVFLDLDSFKLINDTLGHTMGDLLLQATGERLSACLREGDTVARPDEQAIVTTIIQLARNLGLKVIAEGVETKVQLDFLRAK